MTTGIRSDRVLPEARWLAILVIPFLVVAFVILYALPQETERFFAWKLQPTMSAMMLGAAYAGGIYFFVAVLAAKQWQRIKIGFLPVAVFAGVLGIATLLHWDRFNHSHISFFAWAGLYFTAPFLVLGVWLRHRGQDRRQLDRDEVATPRATRWVIGAIGGITLVISVFLFLSPALMIGLWPWTLSPLTARVVSAMFSLPGVVGLGIALDERWSAARVILQSQGFSILLILVAAARAWSEFDRAKPGTWLFVGGLVAMLVGIIALYFALEARQQNAGAALRR